MRRGRLLTIDAAGEVSGLGARFIRRLVQERDLASHKLRGRVMIAEADLADYVESCRRHPIARAGVASGGGRR